ncbi:MAG: hypothetical protein K0R37_942, partial [Arthrobacter sp.]|nr:hypothetical protein [Arthrobacter sp.]
KAFLEGVSFATSRGLPADTTGRKEEAEGW